MTLYEQVVGITEDYLGPAADRFIQRQITFHLHKQPTDLDWSDMPKLQEWIKVSLGLLTEDRKMVDDFSEKLERLKGKS